jgi:hypothetical protein
MRTWKALGLCTVVASLTACNAVGANGDARYVPSAPAARIAEAAKKQALLYISEYGGGVVDVFTYPQGIFTGTLSGLSGTLEGECADKAGDVWIVQAGGHPSVSEFAHGGSNPITSLSDQGENPYGCSVDPVTGDLAVTSEFSATKFQGSVSIWKKASGTPTKYVDPAIELVLWCGYDDEGNLFVDGLPPGSGHDFRRDPAGSQPDFALAELPEGSQNFTNVTLAKVRFPGNLQWDGSEMTVGDPAHAKGSAIDRLQISGSQAKIIGTTILKGSYEVFGSWIAGGTVIGPDEGPSIDAVQLWRYPAGGKPYKVLSKPSSVPFDGPFGAAVSPGR